MTTTDHPRTVTGASSARGVWAPFGSLLGAQAAAALLGLVFWVLVARVVPTRDVGLATAAIGTQTLLGLITSLGLGTFLVAELPRHGAARQRGLLRHALMIVAGAGIVVGAALVAVVTLVVPSSSGALAGVLHDPARALVFVIGCASAAGVLVLDEAVLGLRRAGVQVTRNLVASGVRFPLAAVLLAMGQRDALVLLLAWTLPLVVSLALAWRRLALPAGDAVTLAVDVRGHARHARAHYGLNLFVAAATQLLPVVAALTLSAVDNAAFAVAWLLATFAFLPPYLLTIALFAHGSTTSVAELRSAMRRTLPVALALSASLWLGAWLLGRPVLEVFGGTYADRSADLLVLLVPAGLWMVVKDHLVARWRAESRFALATRAAGVALVIEVSGAVIGAHHAGATGLAVGWLLGMALEIVVVVGLLAVQAASPSSIASRRAASRERGASSVGLVLGAVLAAATLGLVALSAVRGSGDEPSPTPEAAPTPAAAAPCDPDLRLDLSVKTDTANPKQPHLLGREINRLVRRADQAGASIVSTTVSWRTLRPTRGSGYDFHGLDRFLRAASRYDLSVRVQLMHTPAWALDRPSGSYWTPPTSRAELARWGRFVAAVTRHLDGRASYLEAWSEPDRRATWRTPDGPDPRAFVRLMRVAEATAHRIDPDLQVVSGGLAEPDGAYATGLARAVRRLDGPAPFDLLGAHAVDGLAPHAATAAFADLHRLLPKVPLYLGEVGYSTASMSPARRARAARTTLDLASCTPYVQAVSWYHLHRTPWDPAAWSLLDARDRPGVTFAAIRDWTSGADR